MFINLLANAVDASLANGAKPVRIGWRIAESNLVVVASKISGLGIANTENLFVPFYTTKPTGSGVGLALAQQIARAHGGEIRLVNREDGAGRTRHHPSADGLTASYPAAEMRDYAMA